MTYINILNEIQDLIEIIFNFILNIYSIIIFSLLIIAYHFLLFIIRDKKYALALKKYKDPEDVKIEDLKELPLINIIIPAWKEGKIFDGCLSRLKNLSYPEVNIIVNAGGSEETIEIANSYKKYDNFTILYQKTGGGKLKAINDCLNQVNKGIVILIDADAYLTDDMLLKMIFPLTNLNENVVSVSSKIHESVENKDLAKYLYINRNTHFKRKPSKYVHWVGPNSVIKYQVIKAIGKFTEKRLTDDGYSIGLDVISKGFRISYINKYRVESFNYPDKIINYIRQNLRWLENDLFYPGVKKKLFYLKFLVLSLLSVFLFVSLIFIFFNIYIVFIGILFLMNMYFNKIRKILFYKLTNKQNSFHIPFKFFIKIIFYIYVDAMMNIIVLGETLFYRKAYKKRKNIE